MVTGADGVMAGTTTYDAMLWYINSEMPDYKDDVVMVNAMREACHHNLYALVNSAAMNGIGPDTIIDAHELPILVTAWIITGVLWALFIFLLVMWIRGKRKWKATEGYQNYVTMKNTIKAAKKAGTAVEAPEVPAAEAGGMEPLEVAEVTEEATEETTEETAAEEATEAPAEEATEEKPE